MSEVVGDARPTAPYTPGPSAPDASPMEASGAPAVLDGPANVPRDTTPTWEIELLVSGAVLYGLFQVPPFVYERWDRWAPHLATLGRVVGSVALLIGTTAVYALVGCFVAHLALRAYWVALVGAHSVFPGGVRWDKQREYGPIQARISQRGVRPLPEFIARADNAASLVFATGFVLAASALAGALVVVFMLVVLGAAMQVLPARTALAAMVVVIAVAGLASMVASLIDYRFGARIDPDGRTARALSAVMRPAVAAMPAGVRSLSSVLTSNVPKRVAYGAMTVGLGGAYATAIANMPEPGDGPPVAGNYRYFDGVSETRGMHAAHYDALRGPDDDANLPSIQSEVVTEPYVRLFVPYRPVRHNDALVRACPGLRPVADVDEETPASAAAADAILACAARVHRPAIDGRPAGAAFRFHTNPRTGRRGFLMLVPAAALAPGEHRLTVWPAVADGSPAARTPYTIPFWR